MKIAEFLMRQEESPRVYFERPSLFWENIVADARDDKLTIWVVPCVADSFLYSWEEHKVEHTKVAGTAIRIEDHKETIRSYRVVSICEGLPPIFWEIPIEHKPMSE